MYRRRRHSRALLIARSFHSACPCLRQCLYAFRNSFSCPCHGHPYGVHSGTPANFSGGHCAGVPPLPIPNREVKPGCADGTAMQCGRVGSCLFYYQRPWREISEVFFVLSGLSCCPCTDGTPCQIGQCGRVGSRLFSNQSVHLSNQMNAFLFVCHLLIPSL